MKPVIQTRFYDPDAPVDQQRGNCLTAVVASLLELDIDQVPNFVQDDVDSGGANNWFTSLLRFLADRGWRLHYVTPTTDLPLGAYYTAAGISPRGNGEIHHVVVCQDGRMVHDPHPSGDGLLTEERWWALYPIPAGEPAYAGGAF